MLVVRVSYNQKLASSSNNYPRNERNLNYDPQTVRTMTFNVCRPNRVVNRFILSTRVQCFLSSLSFAWINCDAVLDFLRVKWRRDWDTSDSIRAFRGGLMVLSERWERDFFCGFVIRSSIQLEISSRSLFNYVSGCFFRIVGFLAGAINI